MVREERRGEGRGRIEGQGEEWRVERKTIKESEKQAGGTE